MTFLWLARAALYAGLGLLGLSLVLLVLAARRTVR